MYGHKTGSAYRGLLDNGNKNYFVNDFLVYS